MLSTTHFLGTFHSFLFKYLVLFNVDANFYSLLRSLLTRIPCLSHACPKRSWFAPLKQPLNATLEEALEEALLPTFCVFQTQLRSWLVWASVLSLTLFVCSLLCYYDKTPEKTNRRLGEGSVLARSWRIQSMVMGKSWEQLCEAGGHLVSAPTKQERLKLELSLLSPFYYIQARSSWRDASYSYYGGSSHLV